MVTLATLDKATKEEVFYQVSDHLLKQKIRSISISKEGDICAYKNENSLKCAAGCLISDEEYKPQFENKNWSSLVNSFQISSNNQNLITSLQSMHDNENIDDWEKILLSIKDTYRIGERPANLNN